MARFQTTEGHQVVNPLPVDAIRFNNADVPYTDTNQVLSEQILAIRTLGQVYYVDNGSGGIESYWFKVGIQDSDLELKDSYDGFKVVESIDALRLITNGALNSLAVTQSYYGDNKGGGNDFELVSLSIGVYVDNGGSTIIGHNGFVWQSVSDVITFTQASVKRNQPALDQSVILDQILNEYPSLVNDVPVLLSGTGQQTIDVGIHSSITAGIKNPIIRRGWKGSQYDSVMLGEETSWLKFNQGGDIDGILFNGGSDDYIKDFVTVNALLTQSDTTIFLSGTNFNVDMSYNVDLIISGKSNITNCIFEDSCGSSILSTAENASGSVIKNNTFREYLDHSIYLASNTASFSISDVIIDSNVWEVESTDTRRDAVKLTSFVHNMYVTNNSLNFKDVFKPEAPSELVEAIFVNPHTRTNIDNGDIYITGNTGKVSKFVTNSSEGTGINPKIVIKDNTVECNRYAVILGGFSVSSNIVEIIIQDNHFDSEWFAIINGGASYIESITVKNNTLKSVGISAWMIGNIRNFEISENDFFVSIDNTSVFRPITSGCADLSLNCKNNVIHGSNAWLYYDPTANALFSFSKFTAIDNVYQSNTATASLLRFDNADATGNLFYRIHNTDALGTITIGTTSGLTLIDFLDDKVNKSGDVMTGELTVTNLIQTNPVIPSLTWAQLVARNVAGTDEILTGDRYSISDQSNEEILITNKSPDGNTWFTRMDNAGVQTIYKVV